MCMLIMDRNRIESFTPYEYKLRTDLQLPGWMEGMLQNWIFSEPPRAAEQLELGKRARWGVAAVGAAAFRGAAQASWHHRQAFRA